MPTASILRLAAGFVLVAGLTFVPGRAGARERAEIDADLGEGVTIEDPDGRLAVTLRGRIQGRAEVATVPAVGLPATELLIRRMRLVLSGHVLDKAVGFYIQLGFSNLDTEPDLRLPLRDAYLTWAGARDFRLRVGQMKVPFGRQRVISSSALQFVDRSLTTAELNLDRDIGLVAFSDDLFGLDGRLGYAVGVFGGDGRNRTFPVFGLLTVARLELSPFGAFESRTEGDLERLPKPRLALGVGAAWNQQTFRPRSTFGTPYALGAFDYAHAGADLLFKWSGFSLQAELLARWAQGSDRRDAAGETEFARSGLGWYAQAGQMLTDRWEAVARVGEVVPFAGTDPALVRSRELGGGFGHYFDEHALKLQGDYFYLFGDRFDAGRHQVRVQIQLYF